MAEVLEEPYPCSSDRLFCDGHVSVEQLTAGVGAAGPVHRICDSSDAAPNDGDSENVKLFAREVPPSSAPSSTMSFSDGGTVPTTPLTNTAYDQGFLTEEEDKGPRAEEVNNPYAHNVHPWDEEHGHFSSSILSVNGRGGQSYSAGPEEGNEVYPMHAIYGSPYSAPVYCPPQQPMQPIPHQYALSTNSAPNTNYGNPAAGHGDMPYVYGDRKVFMKGRTWQEKTLMIKSQSCFSQLPGWTVRSFIVKSGDDLRKEIVAMQLVDFFRNIFHSEGLDISLRPYRIISTGHQTGLVEFLEGTRSIDSIKKSCSTSASLLDYFEFCFGATFSPIFNNAVHNFVKSLVGYSLITYVLQVKDRHNANILIDTDGHVVHIDFGFILGDSPGFNINFENAPFKLTREYVDVLGGIDSAAFKMFEDLFIRGFFALQKHVDAICTIVQMFYGPRRKNSADALRSRYAHSYLSL